MKTNASRWVKWLFCGMAVAGASVWSLAAEESPATFPPEAKEVLQKAQAHESYRARFLLEAEEEEGRTFRLNGTLWFKKPARRRLEIREGEAEEPTQILVSDGTVEWQYYPREGIVYRAMNPPAPPGPHRPFSEVEPGTLRFVQRLSVGNERRLRFEGRPLAAATEGAPVVIRSIAIEVGEQDGLVRKMELLDQEGKPVLTQTFTELEVNAPVEDDRFVFVPQEGMAVMDLAAPSPAEEPEGPR